MHEQANWKTLLTIPLIATLSNCIHWLHRKFQPLHLMFYIIKNVALDLPSGFGFCSIVISCGLLVLNVEWAIWELALLVWLASDWLHSTTASYWLRLSVWRQYPEMIAFLHAGVILEISLRVGVVHLNVTHVSDHFSLVISQGIHKPLQRTLSAVSCTKQCVRLVWRHTITIFCQKVLLVQFKG